MTKLDNLIGDLGKANKALKEAAELKPTRIHKDATVQRFEFTFELCWKTIQEYIRDQGFDYKSPKGCFREAAHLALIENPQLWFEYLKARNLIAHTYSQGMADRVYRQAVKFSDSVDELLKKLKED